MFKYPLRAVCCVASVVMGIVVLAGCQRNTTVEIAGTVRIDSTAIPQGTIGFRPADGQGPTAEAVIQEGRYQLTMAPGLKKVVIRGYRVVGELHPWGPNAPSAPKLAPIVPPKYNDQSELQTEIREPNPQLDFDLQGK